MATLKDGKIVPAHILKKVWLEKYMELGHIGLTCDAVGLMDRRVLYHWKKKDPKFLEDYQLAEQVALGNLEDEAYRRAVTGVKEPVYQGGVMVGTVTRYSDTLLIVLLKARAPMKYRERFSGELTGADGKPLIGDMKILHVTSNIPLAMSESEVMHQIENEKPGNITDISHEDVK